MRNIYFDICSIPIFVLILWTCHIRRIDRDQASRVFIGINAVSLVCAILDIGSEVALSRLPLTAARHMLATLASYAYLILHNGTLVLCLIFVFLITRTEYLLRPPGRRLLLWTPILLTALTVLQNVFTHNVFTIDVNTGYSCGPLMGVLYLVALLYGMAGMAYTVYCKRYLVAHKWIALFSIYALEFVGVAVQLLVPELLVEMFAAAIGLLMVLLLVMRPEENIDDSVGAMSWRAYKADLKMLLLSGQEVQIVAIQLMNAMEIRRYLGENKFNGYIETIVDEIRRLYRSLHIPIDVYFERPGHIYIIMENMNVDIPSLVPGFLESTTERVRGFTTSGVRFVPKFCMMRCPEDLREYRDIINLGHKFPTFGKREQTVFIASDIVCTKNFEIINHMDDILNRAITEQELVMYYQPIYSLREGRFSSAEALARLIDRQYGMISPGLFIPAAESAGLMLPIGDQVLEQVFRFISQHDLDAMGISYIEINLSVEQCMQSDLPEKIHQLQRKYGVRPDQVNFEITETVFDNLSSIMDKNLRALSDMGYAFSLDDYGVGYSNIQRLSRLPLGIVKIDKSLVDDIATENGQAIIRNTVRMMQEIHKTLVMEGVETKAAVEVCDSLSCDYIQGFYYSKPLPEAAFMEFVSEHNAMRDEQDGTGDK